MCDNEVLQSLALAAASVAALGDLSALSSFSDEALLDAIERAAALRRCSDQVSAVTAAELARRSVFSLGDAGLARAGGFTSTEHMMQVLAGVPRQEAAKLINVGALMTSSDPVAVVLTQALDEGMSIDAVDALRRGLGDANTPAECAELVADAGRRTPEQLFRDARHTRDLHDEQAIAAHEKERSDLRSVRAWWDADGMYCGAWRLPAE